MFSDIVGYTALMGKDSNQALELVRLSKKIQKPLVHKHQGEWLKEMGDGAMMKFSTALDAVNCALEIQRASRADFPADFRIGIHLGDITLEDGDVYGDGVNVASRLESIADPGGIYISESVEKAIRGHPAIQTRYLGDIRLKNVDYAVRTYALQGVGLPVPVLNEGKELSAQFWAEVKRRGVLRAGISYLIFSLLLFTLFDKVETRWSLPPGLLSTMLVTLLILFPIAMYLAWNFEKNPTGFVRIPSIEAWQNPYKANQRKPPTGNLIWVAIGLTIVGMYLYPEFKSNSSPDNSSDDRMEQIDKSIAVLPVKN